MLEPVTTTNILALQYHNQRDTVAPSNVSVQLNKHKPAQAQPVQTPVAPPPDNGVKKRKRDASPSSDHGKRARVTSVAAGANAELKRVAASRSQRPSPAPRAPPTTQTGPVNRWESIIPRQCASLSSQELDASEYVSSYDIVKNNLSNFKTYFMNKMAHCDQAFTPPYMPYIDLEYPMTGATERFSLLSPKDNDGWHPIKELMETVYILVRLYLPDEYSTLLGPNDNFMPPQAYSKKTKVKQPLPTPAKTPERDGSPSPVQFCSKDGPPGPANLIRDMEHAYVEKDGYKFRRAVTEINKKLRTLKNHKDGNLLLSRPHIWKGIPPDLVVHIYEQTYQRSAGPRVKELLKYQAFSSTTYGELNSGLIMEMTHRAGLRPGMKFLDLGSGIGNVVIQTALLSGCTSTGVEKLATTANVAEAVHLVYEQRCQMWGVRAGPTEVFQGDFMENTEKLQATIQNADVILANNFVFDPALNEGLKALFLDLKDGAKIISLRSFCDGQVTERNVGAIESILDVETFEWRSGDVSWGDNTGRYFISTVNRARMAAQYSKVYQEARTSRRRK